MSDPRPDSNAPWLLPYLTVSDAGNSLSFYQQAFGFTPDEMIIKDEQGVIQHASLSYQGNTIMLGPEGAYGSTKKTPKNSGEQNPLSLYIYVDDIDAFYRHAITQGASSVSEPETMFWGDRTAVLKDPDGFDWTFATNVGEPQMPG